LASKRTAVGLAILLGFVTLCGIVNYQRWGDPLKLTDFRSIGYVADPGRLARLEASGVFNGVFYYFFPIWTIIRPDGQFLFSEFETRMLDGVEPPPSSFLLSDPLLLVLGGAFLLRLPRLARERLLDLRAVMAVMIGFPLLEFTDFLGFYAICADLAGFPHYRAAGGPFPKITRQVLGADAVMGADEPGFDVAEQGMDDREELASIGAFALHHRRVLQMLAEGGVAAAIARRTRRSGDAPRLRHWP
jgi:hypothetical protein